MRWLRSIFDPWKIPAYIAGIAFIGFVALVIIKPIPACDINCKLDRMIKRLDRIQAKLDILNDRVRPMPIGKCDLENPLGEKSIIWKAVR